jgi:hypothetical protein
MRKDPFLDAGMRGWIVKTAKKNHWRVAGWYDMADLIQDGYLCYYKCRARYTEFTIKNHPSKDDKRQFMALVQAAFTNHLNTLSTKRTLGQETTICDLTADDDEAASYLERHPPSANDLGDAPLRYLIARAPEEVANFLRLVSGDVKDAGDFVRSRAARCANGRVKLRKRALRETTNDKYNRLLGTEGDIVGRVRGYFTSDADHVDRLVELLPVCMMGIEVE